MHHRLVVKSLADITTAYVTGRFVRTLCDRKIILTRIPEQLPLCPECAEQVRAM